MFGERYTNRDNDLLGGLARCPLRGKATNSPTTAVALMVVLGLVLLVAPSTASGHQTAIKYFELEANGTELTVSVLAQPVDVSDALGGNRDATLADAIAAPVVVGAYVLSWAKISVEAGACVPASPTVSASDEDRRFLRIAWGVACPAPVRTFTLDLSGFFALDSKHQAVIRVASSDANALETVATASQPVLRLSTDAGFDAASIWRWIQIGMQHIHGGPDHIAFVLALLLVVVLVRERATVRLREPRSTARATAILVSSFTLAHSLTLIAASLGWLTLPSKPVELLIAISIVYAAVENVFMPAARWRLAMTFVFGLVHGLGFAGALSELLPHNRVIAPLLLFNLGVELGQLLVVGVVLPPLWLLARRLGEDKYQRRVIVPLSWLLALGGTIWVIQRI